MAFVVSHMHRGIKAAKPSLLLLLCHSVAVHTVIPAAGSRQLLFFLCFIFFFSQLFQFSIQVGRGRRMFRRNLALPLPFLPYWAGKKGELREQRRKDLSSMALKPSFSSTQICARECKSKVILPNQTLQTDVPLGLWTDRNTSLFVQYSARVFTSEGVQLHHLPGLSPYLHICFVLPGERTRNFLRCLSLEQAARVGAKDQLCRGH